MLYCQCEEHVHPLQDCFAAVPQVRLLLRAVNHSSGSGHLCLGAALIGGSHALSAPQLGCSSTVALLLPGHGPS